MTKHAYLPTTLITDKGTAFTSKIIDEITKILEITLKCATTKHPRTIGKLERTHASLKINLKVASGEYRRQWHKNLPLAVLNYNTTYHSSIGCEPSKVFDGRIPYNVLDHKLGNNPNKDFLPTTEFAEELQQRTQILIDKTKQNIMQSYLKYKEYHDRKAKAAPLKEQDFCFILQPKADNQRSKIPFRNYRWIGPYRIEKVLPNDNYIVRRLNTNKTQILHRIRLKKFVPNTPLEDKYSKEKLQPDDEIIIPTICIPSHGKLTLIIKSSSRDRTTFRMKNYNRQTLMVAAQTMITSFMIMLMMTRYGRERPPAEEAYSHETQMTSPK